MKLAYFRRQRKKSKHLHDKQIQYAISESWKLDMTSEFDVNQKSDLSAIQTYQGIQSGFYYVNLDASMLEKSADTSEDASESQSKISTQKPFERFLPLSHRYSPKVAYKQMMPWRLRKSELNL